MESIQNLENKGNNIDRKELPSLTATEGAGDSSRMRESCLSGTLERLSAAYRDGPLNGGLSGSGRIEAAGLEECQLRDLSLMYVECFNGEPWFEDWTEEMAGNVIRGLRDKGADFVLAFSEEGKLMAFSIGISLQDFPALERVQDMSRGNTEYYLAEVGVGEAFRGQRLSTAVVKESLRLASLAGFESVVSTTRRNNPKMRATFERLGFSLDDDPAGGAGEALSERVVYRRELPLL